MTDMSNVKSLLHVFCPMHARLDRTGHIVDCGAALTKLRSDHPMVGRRFLEVFELNRPKSVGSVSELLTLSGKKLHLRFRDAPRTSLKGVAVPWEDGGAVVNLSLGISVLEAVGEYALTCGDFAHTDPTVEMLYLIEAKSAAMEASHSLNLRLQGARIAAEEQAFTDTLTGLKNRRALDHIMSRSDQAREEFALMHLDLDFFKQVNDTLGHAAGDHVLPHVARVMVRETREKDTVARVGGDEFVLIFTNLVDRQRLKSIARRLINRLEEPIPFGGEVCNISASIGIALSNQRPVLDITQMAADADEALYAAKRGGRACYRFFEPSPEDLVPAMATPDPANQHTQPPKPVVERRRDP